MEIKELTKDLLVNNKVEYPEKVAYENFLKFNADYYLNPDDCQLHYSSFGISVIPNCYDSEVHSGLKLSITIDNETNSLIFLSHDIYLGNLVMKKWEAEKENKTISFRIECIRKNSEFVEF
jgi:hypothetical protein